MSAVFSTDLHHCFLMLLFLLKLHAYYYYYYYYFFCKKCTSMIIIDVLAFCWLQSCHLQMIISVEVLGDIAALHVRQHCSTEN